MSTPEITRKQAWMKLAVLIADGLPDPKSIDFHPNGEILSIDLDTDTALAAWAETLDVRKSTPHRGSDGGWIHPAHGQWLGFSLSLVAYMPGDTEPEEVTEDLAEVRRLAGIDPDASRPMDDTVDGEP